MKPQTLFVLAFGLIGMLVGPATEAWAGKGGTAGGTPSCQVPRLFSSNHAVQLKGTAAVNATNIFLDGSDVSDVPSDVDVTLRLEKGPARHFFRLHLFKILQFTTLTNEQTACLFLDPNGSIGGVSGAQGANFTAVEAFVQEILTAFGLEPTRRLVILSNAISKDEPETSSKLIPQTGTLTGTGFLSEAHGSSLADITIYAIVP